jgi:hypothetical protein
MQCGLICDRAGEDGLAIGFVSDGQPVKPVAPMQVEMAFDFDLVESRCGHENSSADFRFWILDFLLDGSNLSIPNFQILGY